MDIETVKLRLYQGLSEDLRKWFKDGGWNRYNTKGEKVGKCARDDKDGDGKADGPKPKCLPASKAASLGKKKVAAAVKRKRSEDPNPNRTGAAKNVKTESVVHEMISTSISGRKYKSIDNSEDQARIAKENDTAKSAKIKAGKERKKELAATRQTKGIKFYDAKGSGYMKDGKKVYEGVTFQQFNEKAQKCWDTHKKVGMKMKGGKMVNDCRPKNEEVETSGGKVEEGKSDRPLGMMHSFSRGVKQKRGEKREVKYGMDSEGNRAGKYNVKKEEVEVEEGAAWTKKSGKSESGGLNEKGRKSYERENPGSDLKAPSKKKGNKRRASFCARMKGMRKRQKPSNNTGEDRLSKSLRAWNC